ncbi:MAG: hypothetical protein KGH91_04495 [Rhodospirillales bacterium]|nr:hypothetical protein [Rhodospirillales bacterium]
MVEHLPGGTFNEAAFARSLASEMAALPPRVRTVIFSNEHCQSRFTTTEHVAKLHALLSPYFDTITIIVYLRRQDEMASSLYSTRLRAGDPVADVLPSINLGELFWASYFNYDQMLDRYAGIFGKAFVKPRIYEPDFLLQGDAVQDFLGICGLPSWLAEGTGEVNRAISADGKKFLSALNAWHVELGYNQNRGLAKTTRDACVIIAERLLQGRPQRPARNDAQNFYENFRDANECVREKWFPHRSRLFQEDFSQYPAFTDDAVKPQEAALRAAFTIIEDLVRQNGELVSRLHVQRRGFRAFMPRRLRVFLRTLLGRSALFQKLKRQ